MDWHRGWDPATSFIQETPLKYTEGLTWGRRTIWQKTGMALLIIILNKISLKKSFSLLSPIFLLVSSEPISIRFLWIAGHRISSDKFINDSHWYSVICGQVQSEGTEKGGGRLGQDSPRQRNSLAKFGPDQWGVLEPWPSVEEPMTYRDRPVLALLTGLVPARSSLSMTPEGGSAQGSNQATRKPSPQGGNPRCGLSWQPH